MINQNHQNNIRPRQNEIYLIEKDAYVLCLHVKPTSLFCGFIILMMSFMHIVMLLSQFTVESNPIEKMSTASNSQLHGSIDPRLKTNKLILLFIIAEALKIVICSLLIYGITRCKPSYLLPFILMQWFYLFRSISFFVENYSHYQSYYNQTGYQVNIVPNPASRHDDMLFFFFSLLIKFYFIACVFKCYKYLKLKEVTMHIDQNFRFRSGQTVNTNNAVLSHQPTNPPSYNDCLHMNLTKDDTVGINEKLPSYDEACKIVVQVADAKKANHRLNNSGDCSSVTIPPSNDQATSVRNSNNMSESNHKPSTNNSPV